MLLSACSGASGGNTIKVGGIAELTSDIPAVGASFKNAAEMAVEEINDARGLEVGGKKYQIELVLLIFRPYGILGKPRPQKV
jgi:branched-chain amino acid transport system substrate-binding protein